MKIFGAVGTQKYPFNRLIDALDAIAQIKDFDVFIQYGNSKKPLMCAGTPFLTGEEYRIKVNVADVAVVHGGVGTIRTALSLKTKVVAVPRMTIYGEHVDDHQREIVAAFAESGYIVPCYELDCLTEAIEDVIHRDFPLFDPEPCAIEEEIAQMVDKWGFDSFLKS